MLMYSEDQNFGLTPILAEKAIFVQALLKLLNNLLRLSKTDKFIKSNRTASLRT